MEDPDRRDEGEETFTLRLDNASGASLGDAEATGTIANTDPLQTMWLARFGRTVAGQVTEVIGARLTDTTGGGSHVTIGGRRLSLAGGPEGSEDATARPETTSKVVHGARARQRLAATPHPLFLQRTLVSRKRAKIGARAGPVWHLRGTRAPPTCTRVHARSKDLWDRHVVPSSPAPARRSRTTSGSASYSGRQRTVKTSRIGR